MSDQPATQKEAQEEKRRYAALEQALRLHSGIRTRGDDPTAEEVLADAQKFYDFLKGTHQPTND